MSKSESFPRASGLPRGPELKGESLDRNPTFSGVLLRWSSRASGDAASEADRAGMDRLIGSEMMAS